MAKVRRLKKKPFVISMVFVFFITYIITFKITSNSKAVEEEVIKEEQVSDAQDPRSLIYQLNNKTKIYISTKDAQNIKIETPNWDELRIIFNNFSKIRKVENYSPIYEGYSEDGIRFSTDLNFFRIYTVNREEYYKVSVSEKEAFQKLLDESVYTSFDFIKQYKTWQDVTVTYLDETKNISKWKFDDLSYKMVSKRIVGKVQPEKNKQKTNINFVINIKGNGYVVIIETMGQDYVKITSEKGEAYYEVPTMLYDYLKNDIFRIK